MSGYELKRKPGLTSIHAAYAKNMNMTFGDDEEEELISPTLLSELEAKMRNFIKNVKVSQSINVEATLKIATEIEEKVTGAIKEMFNQIRTEAQSAAFIVSLNSSEGRVPKNFDSFLKRLEETEKTLLSYAVRVIKMKAFTVLLNMPSKDSTKVQDDVVEGDKANIADKK